MTCTESVEAPFAKSSARVGLIFCEFDIPSEITGINS